MRTSGMVLMVLAIAGSALAQEPAPTPPPISQGAFFPPPMRDPSKNPVQVPLWKPVTPFILNSAQNPYAKIGTPSQCAVPLIEMKTPAATDSIARTPSPNATSDPIAVPPKVPACDAAPPTSAYGAPPAVPAPKAP